VAIGLPAIGWSQSAADYFKQGKEYCKAEKYKQAIEAFHKALADKPGAGEIYVELGFAYRLMDDYEKAKKAYSKAIELDPKDASAHLRLGEVYKLMNMEEQAEKEFAIYRQLTSNQ